MVLQCQAPLQIALDFDSIMSSPGIDFEKEWIEIGYKDFVFYNLKNIKKF